MKEFLASLIGRRRQSRVRQTDDSWLSPGFQGTRTAPSGAYKIGDVIAGPTGRYEIRLILGGEGRSGMGTVYAVIDHKNKHVAALKTFQDRFLRSKEAREAFRQEALAWTRLEQHPHIVQATCVDNISGRLYIILELILPDEQGRNCLQQFLTGQPLPLEEALRWAIQFCHGMEHASARGMLCHGDIKPENIMITRERTAKITDFGLARAVERGGSGGPGPLPETVDAKPGLSLLRGRGGLVCGTAGYIAPEVLLGRVGDVRSDVWSFGVVLHQMATGSTSSFAWRAQCRGDSHTEPPRFDGPLWSIVERCLAYETEKRYRDFAELRGDLEALLRLETGRGPSPPAKVGLDASSLCNAGAALCALGRYQEAIAKFDQGLAMSPRDARILCNKAAALARLGKHREAVACLDRAIDIDPRDPKTWSNKGSALRSLGRAREAVGCFDRALGIDPRYAEAWVNKGNALQALRRHEEAIVCYDRALALMPRSAVTWSHKGLALEELGRYQEVIDCCDRALEIDPLRSVDWYRKAHAEEQLGRPQDAVRAYREFIKLAGAEHSSQLEYARARLEELEMEKGKKTPQSEKVHCPDCGKAICDRSLVTDCLGPARSAIEVEISLECPHCRQTVQVTF